ncbi:MAG: hypothetical protein V7K47_15565 [Nostoc sp.]
MEHFDFFGFSEGRQGASDYAGNTLSNTRRLTRSPNYIQLLKNVGSSDSYDYYRFDLNQASTVSISDYSVSNS